MTGPLPRRLLLGAVAAAPLGLLACTEAEQPIVRDPITCGQGGNPLPQDLAPPDPEELISPTLAFNGDRSEVAAVHGVAVVVWSTGTGRILRRSGTSQPTYNWGLLAANPQQPMFARDTCAAQVQLLDSTTWTPGGMLTGHTEIEAAPGPLGLQHFTFSPDGEYVASCGHDGLVKIWRVSDRAEVRNISSVRGDGAQQLAFSPDGSQLLGSSLNHPPVVWDVATGEEVAVLDQVEQSISPSWSPDGTRLVFSDWSGGLHLHDGTSFEPLESRTFSVRPKETAWTADGTHVVMTTEQPDELAVWQVDSADVVVRHCPDVDGVHPAADAAAFHTSSARAGIQTWRIDGEEPELQFELPQWDE